MNIPVLVVGVLLIGECLAVVTLGVISDVLDIQIAAIKANKEAEAWLTEFFILRSNVKWAPTLREKKSALSALLMQQEPPVNPRFASELQRAKIYRQAADYAWYIVNDRLQRETVHHRQPKPPRKMSRDELVLFKLAILKEIRSNCNKFIHSSALL